MLAAWLYLLAGDSTIGADVGGNNSVVGYVEAASGNQYDGEWEFGVRSGFGVFTCSLTLNRENSS